LFHGSINITGNNLLCASKRTAIEKLAMHIYKSERTELQKLAMYDFPKYRFPEHFSRNISKDM